ncbi:MAG TPA: hypothetical protein VHU80_05270 [Polyangiaceae bacterium]|jgi:hypothetical protein|nr:hypothetical protein [Polyangiaceae bacterium]
MVWRQQVLRQSRIPLVLGTLLCVSGCGHPIERTLAGRWFGESVESFDSADVAAATGWARGASMEFSDEAITVAIPAEDPRKGRYEVASAHEGDIVLAIRDDKGHSEKARFTLDGDHYLKWHLDERRSIVLRREQ